MSWRPLEPLADPAAAAQPLVAALMRFWERVLSGHTELSPEHAANVRKFTLTQAGVSTELDELLDLPLSIATLQTLHIHMTRDQTATRVLLKDGTYRYTAFPYGKLKDRPNHLTTNGRITEEFCPPERVTEQLEEMLRLYHTIPATLPEVRAAWLVHAFLRVHPFVDGNGRVSRVLINLVLRAADLPPVWGDTSERGPGWHDALAEAGRSGDLTPITALLAAHQERLTAKILLHAEAAPAKATLDEVLAHRDRLAVLRARWHDAAQTGHARMPRLAALASEALGALAAKLDLVGELAHGPDALAWKEARKAGWVADVHVTGAFASLRLGTPRSRFRIGLAALGTSGTGAVIALARIAPTPGSAPVFSPLVLLPEEDNAAAERRFVFWLDSTVADLLGAWLRIA